MTELRNHRFHQGILFNYISLGILGLSGFAFNIIIVRFYDVAALGLFHQAYAWYMVLSQVASLGVHTSALSYLSDLKASNEQGTILKSALLLTFLSSIIVVCCFEMILPFFLSGRTMLLKSMRLLLPGLIFFSMNKVLLNYFNAVSAMKTYAFFQSLRYLLITCTMIMISVFRMEIYIIMLSFLLSEAVLFVILLCYTAHKRGFTGKVRKDWIVRHLIFGFKVFPSNMVLEINTKVDVLCLGALLKDDYIVGIYTFASIFADGIFQSYVVVRRSINPDLAKADEGNPLQMVLQTVYRKLRTYLRFLLPAICLAALAAYKVLCAVMELGQEYNAGLFIILIIGISAIATGRMLALGNIFSQTKHPEIESLLNIFTVFINFIFNIIFILSFGMLGAAMGTAVSYLFFGVALKVLCKKRLKVII